MTIEIVEIQRRATQGTTLPFLCQSNDGCLYFVKGKGAGNRSLICEWVAGNLAFELGLPIAPFDIVHVPEQLVETASNMNLADLGAGAAFGSKMLSVTELTMVNLPDISDTVQRDVLAFDWWVRNSDRTLTHKGGNPNLFIEPETSDLVVIDHNLAFDRDFNKPEFLQSHAFSGQSRDLLDDMIYRQQYSQRFREVLANWDEICDSVPKEWLFVDDEESVKTDFDFAEAFNMLTTCDCGSFWNDHD